MRCERIDFDIDLKPLDDADGSAAGDCFSATKGQFNPKLGLAWACRTLPAGTVSLIATCSFTC